MSKDATQFLLASSSTKGYAKEADLKKLVETRDKEEKDREVKHIGDNLNRVLGYKVIERSLCLNKICSFRYALHSHMLNFHLTMSYLSPNFSCSTTTRVFATFSATISSFRTMTCSTTSLETPVMTTETR